MIDTMKLTFLPWLTIPRTVAIGEVTFIPFSTSDGDPSAIFADVSDDIVRILSGYRGVNGKPIDTCTLVYLDEQEPCSESADDKLIANAIHLLAFAGIAQNKYCVNLGNYINSSCFESVVQMFRKGSEFITLTMRRRDGQKYIGGMKHGEVSFSIPNQCTHVNSPEFDDDFVASLRYVLQENEPLSKRMMQSIWLFDEACSDSYTVSLQREVILFASAFEQSLNCKHCYELTKIFGDLLKDYGSITVENSNRLKDIAISTEYGHAERQWYLSRKWIEELYDLRSYYTHGEDTQKRSWGWNDLEHTLMASFAFPLIVKILLAQQSKYTLTEDDRIHAGAIDKLLNALDWFEPPDPSEVTCTWQEVISDHKLSSRIEEYFEKNRKKQNSHNEAEE